MMNTDFRRAFSYAFPLTVPIAVSFLFLGISFGIYSVSLGYPWYYPTVMGTIIFAGSMEFLAVGLMLGSFLPLETFLITLTVNARHIFYGLAMLRPYGDLRGAIKAYLIYGMCDETFALNATTTLPDDVDRKYFYFHVTWLNHVYWVAGTTAGALFGTYLSAFDLTGIEFVLTAMFVVIFLEMMLSSPNARYGLGGLAISAAMLAAFGAKTFLIPALAGMSAMCVIAYYVKRRAET